MRKRNLSAASLRADHGMTLVEMSVAMAMFAFVIAALTAAIGAGLRAVVVARQSLVARTAAEDTLERMRALPFYENRATAPTDVDVLDLWFPDTQPGASGDGYNSADLSYKTIVPLDGLASGEMVVVATFVFDTTGAPIAPSPSYDHTNPTSDTPPSRMLDVEIAVSWDLMGRNHSYDLASTVGSKTFAGMRGRSEASAVALTVSTGVLDPLGSLYTVTLKGPEASSSTFLGDMSRAAANATGARVTASLDNGTSCTTTGADSSATAPPTDGGTTLSTESAGDLTLPCPAGSRTAAGIPATALADLSAGFPSPYNLPASGVTARMFPPSPPSTSDFALFGDVGTDSRQLLSSDDDGPIAQVGIHAPPAPPEVSVAASADEGSGASFDSSVSAGGLGMIDVLPTAFAPHGVVRVDLASVSLSCSAVSGTGVSSAAGAFTGSVSYWDAGAAFDALGNPLTSDDGYVTVPITSGVGSDPLAAVNRTSIVVTRQYGTDEGGNAVVLSEVHLSDYVKMWQSLEAVSSGTSADGTVSVEADGIVSIVTTGTVAVGNQASEIALHVGEFTCSARDAR